MNAGISYSALGTFPCHPFNLQHHTETVTICKLVLFYLFLAAQRRSQLPAEQGSRISDKEKTGCGDCPAGFPLGRS